jgi:hypothetical protein
MLFFILPGWFYLKAVALSDERGSTARKVISWIYIIFGFMVMIGGLTSVVVKLVEDENHDSPDDPE